MMLSRVSTMLVVVVTCGPALVRSIQFLQLDSDMLPDDGHTTLRGCRCKSSCAAREEDGFSCDGCATDEYCSQGGWDYCVYPQDDDFEEQDYRVKMDDWWAKIARDSTPANFPNPFGLLNASMMTSFDNLKDELPAERIKWVHTRASICKFEVEITAESTYTGLLGPGKREGLIRMGSGLDPDVFRGINAALALKFARTGVRSGDLLTMHSAVPQGWNFFEQNQSNFLPPTLPNTVITHKFRQASQCSNQVGVSDLARYSQDGTEYDTPYFPFKLFMVPSKDAQQQMPLREESLDALHEALDDLDVGTTLFSMYACDEPAGGEMTPTTSVEEACGSPLKLGDIVTTSRCTTSKYGDEKFFIRHQRIEEDWKYRPDFLESYDAASACGWPLGTRMSADAAPNACADPHGTR